MNEKGLAYIDVTPEFLFLCIKKAVNNPEIIPDDAEVIIMDQIPCIDSMKEGVMNGYRLFIQSEKLGPYCEGQYVPRIQIYSWHIDKT